MSGEVKQSALTNGEVPSHPLCTFVSFVVGKVKMLEAQRT